MMRKLKPYVLASRAALAMLALGASLGMAVQAQTPAKPKTDQRVQTLATDGEAVIDVAVQRGQLTHVVLPPGESFTLPPATGQGARCDDETHAWCIVAQGRDLFIKAKPSAKSNNLILVTERRRFALELRAVDRGGLMRLSLMPPTNADTVAASGSDGPGAAKAVRVASLAADPQRLLQERLAAAPIPRNAQYSMAVGKASEDIAPSMVFDDGRFTYLKFPGNRPLPAIFQTSPDGSEETVNVRMGEDELLVADRVARKLILRLGQSVVVVVNDAFDLEGQAPVEGTTVPGVARALSQVPRPLQKPAAATPTRALPVRAKTADLPAPTLTPTATGTATAAAEVKAEMPKAASTPLPAQAVAEVGATATAAGDAP